MSRAKRTTKAGQSILQGAREALAYARGEKTHGCIVHVPDEIDVKAIRNQTHMSQGEFSRSYGFSKRSLEQWEQGRRTPTGAAVSDGDRSRTGRRTTRAAGTALTKASVRSVRALTLHHPAAARRLLPRSATLR